MITRLEILLAYWLSKSNDKFSTTSSITMAIPTQNLPLSEYCNAFRR